jgi:hypothetical protein
MRSYPAVRRARVWSLTIAGVFAAASLCACGAPDYNAMGVAYDKNVHDSCVSTASKSNPAAMAETYCSCVVTQLDKLPVQQRLALSPTSQQVTDAAATCNAQVAGPPAATNDTAAPAPSNAGM